MTDQHTHILPGMDDGSRSLEMSLELLRAEAIQGVNTVILTPHYYRTRESGAHFLERRSLAFEKLSEAILALPEEDLRGLPSLVLGAEVAWAPDLIECSHLPELCFTGTQAFLLELPMAPWHNSLLVHIRDLMTATGLMPVIAHIDRYWSSQKPELLKELFSMGLPIQLSADTLLHFSTRGKALKALLSGQVRYLMSDCHDPRYRKPNLGDALQIVEKKLGADMRRRLESETDSLMKKYALEKV